MLATTTPDKTELRRFAGNFATGVAVVTTRSADGANFGLTMNAVTSLSLSPPLFLICLDNASSTLVALQESKVFCLHYLAQDQKDVSNIFASKHLDKFETVKFSKGNLGCPVLDGVVAAAECKVVNAFPGGDHTIIVGAVQSIHEHGGDPLVFLRGSYVSVQEMCA